MSARRLLIKPLTLIDNVDNITNFLFVKLASANIWTFSVISTDILHCTAFCLGHWLRCCVQSNQDSNYMVTFPASCTIALQLSLFGNVEYGCKKPAVVLWVRLHTEDDGECHYSQVSCMKGPQDSCASAWEHESGFTASRLGPNNNAAPSNLHQINQDAPTRCWHKKPTGAQEGTLTRRSKNSSLRLPGFPGSVLSDVTPELNNAWPRTSTFPPGPSFFGSQSLCQD